MQEYTRLQELHLDRISRRNELDNRINNLKRFEQGRSEVRVKRELLLQTARREFEERREVRQQAINIFNSKSEELYSAPGDLVVDVGDTGFRFDVEIMRSGSQGINNMKIFCYDHMLAQLWANKQPPRGARRSGFHSLLAAPATVCAKNFVLGPCRYSRNRAWRPSANASPGARRCRVPVRDPARTAPMLP